MYKINADEGIDSKELTEFLLFENNENYRVNGREMKNDTYKIGAIEHL